MRVTPLTPPGSPVPFLQSSKFIHARSELAVGVYKLKPRGLMLHHEFLRRLRQLPTEYSYGEYRELLRDFGTHFIKEATVGGIYEYTLVMNSEELRKAGVSEGGEGDLGVDFGWEILPAGMQGWLSSEVRRWGKESTASQINPAGNVAVEVLVGSE